MSAARPHLPPPPPLSQVHGECHRCSRLILFGDYGRLEKPTGWVWSTEPGAHLRPLCGRCKQAKKRC
jgi:hypothetical protein